MLYTRAELLTALQTTVPVIPVVDALGRNQPAARPSPGHNIFAFALP